MISKCCQGVIIRSEDRSYIPISGLHCHINTNDDRHAADDIAVALSVLILANKRICSRLCQGHKRDRHEICLMYLAILVFINQLQNLHK